MPPSAWQQVDFEDAFEDLHLSLLARGSSVVVILGAGASYEAGVPLGDEIKTRLERILPDRAKRLEAQGHTHTLEAFLDALRGSLPRNSQQAIARLLADTGIPGRVAIPTVPTLSHLLVARMAAAGIVRLIVSLNFDELLERCLEAEIGQQTELVRLPRNRRPFQLRHQGDPGWVEVPRPGEKWVCLAAAEELHDAEHLVYKRGGTGYAFQCAVLKPHGTISRPETLVAAHRDVTNLAPSMRQVLSTALGDGSVTFLFIGCSFRDPDFYSLYAQMSEIKAEIIVMDVAPLEGWLRKSREWLTPDAPHPFELPAFQNAQIIYAECRPHESVHKSVHKSAPMRPSDVSPAATDSRANRILTAADKLPGNALLDILSRASHATGNLQERNAPSATDLQVHGWVRQHIVGRRPALESFLATEILIEAAIENGPFSKDRVMGARRHLSLASKSGYADLIDGIFERFVELRVFLPSGKQDRFVLRKIKSRLCRVALPDLLGPLNARTEADGSRLEALLIDLAENKARRSNWATERPESLLSMERGTPAVLATTNELWVVSEYGTWMRQQRNAGNVLDVLKRTKKNSGVQVILASPPPSTSQGYIEWIISALWLSKLAPRLALYVLDEDKHDHHMTLGQQIGIDFKRAGVSLTLHDSAIRYGYGDKRRLQAIFKDYMEQSESFLSWQLAYGLHLVFDAFAIQHLFATPIALDKVTLQYDSSGDRTVGGTELEEAQHLWDMENALRRDAGNPALVANPLFRPVSARYTDGSLVINSGITTYFDNFFLQSRSEDWDEGRTIGAGLSVVPVCQDGEVLLGKRSRIVASGVGTFHIAGGHAHPAESFRQVPSRLTDAVYQELEEEMHIGKDEVAEVSLLGLVVDLASSKPEFVVEAKLQGQSGDYIAKWMTDVAGQSELNQREEEFTEIRTLRSLFDAESTAVKPFAFQSLWRISQQLIPVCRAALTTYWLCHEETDVEEVEPALQ